MNNTKRVLVALTLSGAVLSMSGAAEAATASSHSTGVPVDGPLEILGIGLSHILHGLGLGVDGQLPGNARGETTPRASSSLLTTPP